MNLQELLVYIEELGFKNSMLGYDKNEVDDELDKICDTIEELVKKKDDEIESLKKQLRGEGIEPQELIVDAQEAEDARAAAKEASEAAQAAEAEKEEALRVAAEKEEALRQRDEAKKVAQEKREESYQARLQAEELREKNDALTARIRKDHTNSSKPSSMDPTTRT